MKLLKNKRAWNRWCKKTRTVLLFEPKEYPCFAYDTRNQEEYIYEEDLNYLLTELQTARQTSILHCNECKKHQPYLNSFDRCDAQLRKLKYSPA